jgi:HlyD family secretion protein
MSKSFWAITAITCLAVAGWLLVNKSATPPQPTDTASAPLSITVAYPVQEGVAKRIVALGRTIPQDDVLVLAELSGLRLESLHADVGSRVQRGQLLATMSASTVDAELQQARAEYERLASEHRRTVAVAESGGVSTEVLEQRRTAMFIAEKKLDEAQINERRTKIVAAHAGLVYEKNAALGTIADQTNVLFRIAKDSRIEVEIELSEHDLPRVALGQRAEVNVAGLAASAPGQVRVIAPAVDSNTRLAKVRIALESDTQMPIGAFAKVNILLDELTGLSLPATALQEDADGSFVWRVDDVGRVSRLAVTLLERASDKIFIAEIPRVAVAARAGAFLRQGDTVRVVQGERP